MRSIRGDYAERMSAIDRALETIPQDLPERNGSDPANRSLPRNGQGGYDSYVASDYAGLVRPKAEIAAIDQSHRSVRGYANRGECMTSLSGHQ